ncbi:UNVERIFIED_CONTAM: S-layer family protein [Acetivibrio alkalicellulosi]
MKLFKRCFSMGLIIAILFTNFSLNGISRGNSKDNIVYAESEGINSNWIPRDSGTINNLRDIVYGDNLFVAVGNEGAILTSSDGVSWTQRESNTTNTLNRVIYSGTNYVIVGSSGTILTSQNGIEWIKRTSPISANLRTIAYGDGTYVISGASDPNPINILRSNNAISWELHSGYIAHYGSMPWISIGEASYLNNKFVLSGNYGNVYFSNDSSASTWNHRRNSGYNGVIHSHAYGNGVYVLSADATRVLTSQNNGGSVDIISTNGGTIVRFLHDKFYLGGTEGMINTSHNGTNWTLASSDGEHTVTNFAYADNTYFAIGVSGMIMESLDGMNFNTVESRTNNSLRRLATSDTMLVVVGDHGTIVTKRFNGVVEDIDLAALDKYELTDSIILNGNASLEEVTDNLNLIHSGPHGSIIEWETNNSDIIASDGTVTRPPFLEEDAVVILTAIITKNLENVVKEFFVTVKKAEYQLVPSTVGELSIGDKVVDTSWEWEFRTEGNYSGTGEIKPVSWIVVAKDHYDVEAEYSHVTLLSEELIAIYPFDNSSNRGHEEYGYGHWGESGTPNATHGLRPFLNSLNKAEGYAYTGNGFYYSFSDYFKKSVLSTHVSNKEWGTGEFYSTLDKVFIPSQTELNGGEANTFVIGSVLEYFDGAENEDRIAKLGELNQRYVTRSSHNTVIEGVRLVENSGSFATTRGTTNNGVRPMLNLVSNIPIFENIDGVYEIDWNIWEIQNVEKTKAELEITYEVGDSVSSVTQSLGLPLSGINGTVIEWESSHPEILSHDGQTVNRAEYGKGDKEVTLTATISKGLASDTKVFNLIIKELEQTDEEAVELDKTAITSEVILNGNISLSEIIGNLSLVSQGLNGSSISWSSSNTHILSNNGIVRRPQYSEGDIAITLTATISKGAAIDTRVFNVIIKSLPMSDEEAVQAQKSSLELIFTSPDSASGITKDIILPQHGENNTTINWTSNISAYISNAGVVTRPSRSAGDQIVTLTAIISRGTYSSSKSFTVTVLADLIPPAIEAVNPARNATNIDRNPTITIRFTKPILAGPSFNEIQVIEVNGAPINITTFVSGDTITIIPMETLDSNTNYDIVIPDGVVIDISDNTFEAPMVRYNGQMRRLILYRFKTQLTWMPPSVERLFPSNNAENITLNPEVNIEFNERIHPGSDYSNIQLRDNSGSIIESSVSIDGNILSIKPTFTLSGNTRYVVVIPVNSIKNSSNIGLNSELSFEFTTGTASITSTPQNNTSDVAVNVSPTIVFNSSVLQAANFGDILLVDSEDFAVPISVDINNNVLTINTSSDLNFNTRYIVRIPNGAVVNDMGQPNGDFIFSFTTAREIQDNPMDFQFFPLIQVVGDSIDFEADYIFRGIYRRHNRHIEEFQWDMGDGSIVTGNNPQHTYTSLGTYQVTLTVTDNKGQRYTQSQDVTIMPLRNIKMTVSPQGVQNVYTTNRTRQNDIMATYEVYISASDIPLRGRTITVSNGAQLTTDVDGRARLTIRRSDLDYGRNLFTFRFGNQRISTTINMYEGTYSNYVVILEDVEGLTVRLNDETINYSQRGSVYTINNIPMGEQTLTFTAPYYQQKTFTENFIRKQHVKNVEMSPEELSTKPVIRWVTSEYTNSRNKWDKMFFQGVNAFITLRAEVDWKGHKPGYILFTTPNGEHKEVSGSIRLNMGALAFGRITAQAVSAFGVSSSALDTKINVVAKPPLVNYKFVNGKYNLSLAAMLPGGNSPRAPSTFPLFSGHAIGFDSDAFSLHAELDERDPILRFTFGGQKSKDIARTKAKQLEFNIGAVEINGAMSAEMEFKYNDKKKEWRFHGGTIYVYADGAATVTVPFKIVVVPCYLSGTIGLTLEGGLGMTLENRKIDVSGSVALKPRVEIAVGAGVRWLKSVEGYLGGELGVAFTYPDKELDLSAEITGGVRARMSRFWTVNYRLLRYRWNTTRTFSSMNLIDDMDFLFDSTQYEMLPRTYLNNQSGWLSGGNVGIMSVPELYPLITMSSPTELTADVDNQVLQQGIYPYPEPALINIGSQVVMVWVDDNPSRPDMNHTELKYSLFNGVTWEMPRFMDLSHTSDFNPVMSNTSDRVLLSWESMNKLFGEDATPEDMDQSSEIAVAWFDPSTNQWSGYQVLTSDEYLDHSPSVAAADDTAILTWIKNRSNLPVGSLSESDEIVYSKWNGSNWSIPQTIASDLGAVISIATAYNGDKGILAYVLDTDDDLETENDHELYIMTYEDGQWSNPVQITSNNVQNSTPQIGYIENEPIMVWFQEDRLVYTRGDLQENPISIEGTENGNKDYILVKDEGRAAIVYSEHTGEGTDIFAFIYDAELDKWSGKIRLTDNQILSQPLNSSFDSEGNLMVSYTMLERTTSVSEGEEFPDIGRTDFAMVTLYPKRDLSILAENILVSQENPVPGSTITISAVINNEGEFSERNIEVSFYDGNPLSGGEKIGTTQVISESILPRMSGKVSVEWVVPQTNTARAIYVVVDPDEKIQDIDRTNNIAKLDIVAPDLEIVNVEYYPINSTKYIIIVDVANIGNIDVLSSELQLFEGYNGVLSLTEDIGELRSGEQTQLFFLWDSTDKEFINDRYELAIIAATPPEIVQYTEENSVFVFDLVRAPLLVESFTPGENVWEVSPEQDIQIQFSMDIQEGRTFSEMLLMDEEGNVVSFNSVINRNTLTVYPEEVFDYNKAYTLMINSGNITSVNGSDLSQDFTLAFTTHEHRTNPVITFTYPTDGMIGASRTDDINVIFSETIKAGPNFGQIQLVGPGNDLININTVIEDNHLIITPSSLMSETRYTLTIPQGSVVNLSEAHLLENYTFSFTTIEDLSPSPEPTPTPTPSPRPRPIAVPEQETVHPVTDESGEQTEKTEIEYVLQRTGVVTEEGYEIIISSTNRLEVKDSMEKLVKKLEIDILTEPIEIRLEVETQEGTRLDFKGNNQYIPRNITLDRQVDPAKTTGVLYNPDTREIVPVPTLFSNVDGKTIATIKHSESGIYAIVSTHRTFEDVKGHWAKEQVETLASKLIISGMGDGTYNPESNVTRAEFATLIVRSLGIISESSKNEEMFADVEDQWFTQAVNIAAQAGIFSGHEGKFRPNDFITREEVTVVIMNVLNFINKSVELGDTDAMLERFIDNNQVNNWAKQGVTVVAQAGIISGNDKGELNPRDNATRAEAASMLLRTLMYIEFIN